VHVQKIFGEEETGTMYRKDKNNDMWRETERKKKKK